MSSFLNSNYFQGILRLLEGDTSTVSSVWGMFWQCFYAVVGCIIGAVVFGNYGALIGTVIGAWMGFRAVHPYRSLLPQLTQLNDRQKQSLTDDIRSAVNSSSVDDLYRFATNGNGKQMILDIIQRYLTGNNRQAHGNQGLLSGIFSRFFS